MRALTLALLLIAAPAMASVGLPHWRVLTVICWRLPVQTAPTETAIPPQRACFASDYLDSREYVHRQDCARVAERYRTTPVHRRFLTEMQFAFIAGIGRMLPPPHISYRCVNGGRKWA